MSLSCSCDWDPDPGEWWYEIPDDYSVLDTKRRQRCAATGCGCLIDVGATVAKFRRRKVPETDVEVRIYGEDGEIPLADWYLCEECADLWFSLYELGFECVGPNDVRNDAKEYAENYGGKETSVTRHAPLADPSNPQGGYGDTP